MNTIAPVAITASEIDRLVDAELDEPARTALIRALDRDPDGWKRCALAFLEAQSWREATQAMAAPAPAPTKPAHQSNAPASPILRQLLAIAAMVAVAFCAGFVARGTGPSERFAGRDPRDHGLSGPESGVRIVQAAAAEQRRPPAVPEYVRSQMERQGYRVEGGHKVIELALGDGRRVAVPVDTVSYRYVGQRIH